MKFRCAQFPRLHVYGAGRFAGGVLETDDPAAIARIERVADTYDIKAVVDGTDPFDPADAHVEEVLAYLAIATPAEHARVLELEAAGRKRVTILRTGEPAVPANGPREIADRPEGSEVFVRVDAPDGDAPAEG